MLRSMSLLVVGAAALGYTLLDPAVSQAQTRFGLHVDVGPVHVDVGRGVHRPAYFPGYLPGYPSYGYYRGPGWGHHHHHDYYSPYRSPIVVPEYYHWTPDRGYHSHGTILTPHRGHYHARPY
jgi:hypothetical protein